MSRLSGGELVAFRGRCQYMILIPCKRRRARPSTFSGSLVLLSVRYAFARLLCSKNRQPGLRYVWKRPARRTGRTSSYGVTELDGKSAGPLSYCDSSDMLPLHFTADSWPPRTLDRNQIHQSIRTTGPNYSLMALQFQVRRREPQVPHEANHGETQSIIMEWNGTARNL